LQRAQIPLASNATVEAWDSVATVTLINVIEEEFGIELDLDRVAEFDSFERLIAEIHGQVHVP
jgi:acyl carrier protein